MLWESQAGESPQAYDAFIAYLKNRSIKNVAEMIQKTYAHTRRLAVQNNWRERARAFDNALIEETRQKITSELSGRLMTQWQQSGELQNAAVEALRKKDWSKASFKSLNEIYHAAIEAQLKLLEVVSQFGERAETDSVIRIIKGDGQAG